MHRFELVSLRSTEKTTPLLPIFSESPAAATSSPLAPYVQANADVILPPTSSSVSLERTSDVAAQLLTPSGPWSLRFDIHLPDCSSGLHFTNKSSHATVVVSHILKVIFRVGRGDNKLLDAKGNRKQFDIIVETPIHILSVSLPSRSLISHSGFGVAQCRSNPEWTLLPTYTQLLTGQTAPGQQQNCHCAPDGPYSSSHHRVPDPVPLPMPPILGRGAFGAPEPAHVEPPPVMHFRTQHLPHPHRSHHGTGSAGGSGTSTPLGSPSELATRTEQFARLVAGQESEAGETPPAYVVVE